MGTTDDASMRGTVAIATIAGTLCAPITTTTVTRAIGRPVPSVAKWRSRKWWRGTGRTSTTGRRCPTRRSSSRRNATSAARSSILPKGAILPARAGTPVRTVSTSNFEEGWPNWPVGGIATVVAPIAAKGKREWKRGCHRMTASPFTAR